MGGHSKPQSFRFVYSEDFAPLLEELGISLFVTTYQANKLLVIRAQHGRVSMLMRSFDRAMGIAVDHQRLAIATKKQLWFLASAPDIARQVSEHESHDICFVPRRSHVTGDISCHEITWGRDHELWVVNTRFSCLCTLAPDYSFVPRWQPRQITKLAPEDRCHLNGLEMNKGRPEFVTALGTTDTVQGWRDQRISGGCVIHVPTGETVSAGLCMPHSPRLHQGQLWLLESGRGRLCTISQEDGKLTEAGIMGGYVRGLDFCDDYAFVGLSKARDTASFHEPDLQNRETEICGIRIVSLKTGTVVASLDFEAGVEEIFDLRLLRNARNPAVIGMQKDTVDGIFIVPQNVPIEEIS